MLLHLRSEISPGKLERNTFTNKYKKYAAAALIVDFPWCLTCEKKPPSIKCVKYGESSTAEDNIQMANIVL